jgi:hypothetical protein
MACHDCPCPAICAGGGLCELASDPSRHAHIRNVSAIKRDMPPTEPMAIPVEYHPTADGKGGGAMPLPGCCR